MKVRPLAGALLCLSSLSVSSVLAQTNSEINAGLQFNFSNPGARSLALGGAFIGLADDATAAYTNPAGLTNLSRPEISVEGRYFEFKNEFLDRGHATGTPSGKGLDTIAGPVFAESKDHVTNLSFASIVYPGNGWAIAGYRQELANFEASSKTFGAFLTNENGDTLRFFPVKASVRLKIVNYGISGAVRLADGLSLGAGASRFEYRQTTLLTRYNVGDLFNDLPSYVDSAVVQREHVNGDDSSYAFNAGLLWKASRSFSIGAVYRKGPHFDFSTSGTDGAGQPLITPQNGEFRVPDVYGAGIAVRPTDYLTISFDFDRIRYSQFSDHFIDIFGINEDGKPPFEPQNYKIDDGNEYRLGVQWAIPMGQNVLALRVGGWSDPDHRVRYTGTLIDEKALFEAGKTEYHYSGGVGLTIGEHFQIDLGADISKFVKTGAASAVFRF